MAGNGLLSTLGSYIPDVLRGDSPAEQRMAQGGGILSNLGGLAGDVGNTLADYSPAGAVKQAISPQGAGLAALVGLGGALAVHGYHQWKAGNLPFDEAGSIGAPEQPFNEQRMQPPLANPPSFANTDYRAGLYPIRVDRLLHANTAEGVAQALTKHNPEYDTVIGKHMLAMQGIVNDLGDSLLNNVDAHGAWANQYAGGRPAARAAAAAWSLAQLDTAYHRGLIDSPQFRQDYERFLTRAHTITDERQPLIQAATTLSKELAWTYSPDLALPAPLDMVGMRFTPDGIETTVAYRRGALPHDVTEKDRFMRERALNYQAAIPMFVDNKLHIINNAEDLTAPYENVGSKREGAGDRIGDPQWYFKAHQFAKDLAVEHGVDPWETAPAVVAAMSPRASWPDNTDAARQLMQDYTAAKEDQGGTVTRPFLPRGRDGRYTTATLSRYKGILADNLAKGEGILTGQQLPQEVLQSLKVMNFGTNITDPFLPHPVTVDTLNQDGAFGYRTGNKNPVMFEAGSQDTLKKYGSKGFSPRGANAYESLATADRLVARYTGMPTASAAQASAWTPISYIANRAKGMWETGAPSDMRTVILGYGNPGPGFVAGQAASYSAAGDVLAPTKQPELGRKGALDAPAFLVTARPDGSFLVFGRRDEPGVRDVLRTLRPLGGVGDTHPFDRWVPVVPRPVESADDLRAALNVRSHLSDAASRVEVHNGAAPDGHPSIVSGNWFHYTVDGQDENKLRGVEAAVKGLKADATTNVAQPHTVWEPDSPLVKIGPDDLERMGPGVFSSDQSPLNKLQWTGISGELSGRKAADNAKAHRQLGAELRRRGYQPIETKGVYGGSPERSYLVFGMPNSEAIEVAKDFGQDSVATPSGLYYPAQDKYREWDGNPSTIEVVGSKGKKTLKDNYGEIEIGGKQIRFSRGYDWADDDPVSDIQEPDQAHQASPKVRQELRVHLGPVVSPQVVQSLADLGREQGVRMKAYLHGDVLKPNGFAPVAEHVFNDVASTVIHQGHDARPEDPNSVMAYLPEGDALAVAPGRHPLLDEAHRKEAAVWPDGSAVVNGELRVVTPGVELDPKNPLVAKVNGEAAKRFAMYIPDAVPGQPMELPEVAFGDDAAQQLAARQPPRPPNRVVAGTVKGRSVTLQPPAAGAGQDMVLFHVAREYLARHGVKVGERAAPLPTNAEETA